MFREFRWEIYDGRPIVICGSPHLAGYVLEALVGKDVGEIALCDLFTAAKDYPAWIEIQKKAFLTEARLFTEEEYRETLSFLEEISRLPVKLLTLEELPPYEECFPIIAGKAGIKMILHALGCQDPRMLYSAVPILTGNFQKQEYFGYFNRYLKKQRGLLAVGGMDVVLTTGCSLKCRDCANLLQYYPHGAPADESILLGSLARFLDAVDGVGMLKLLGGEPLLVQGLIRSVLTLLENPRYRKMVGIQIITNGTLLFSEETLVVMEKEPLLGVYLSDYGRLSKREEALKRQLSEHHISWVEPPKEYLWTDHGRPTERLCELSACGERWRECTLRVNCCTLLDGRFYLCPRAAHGTKLGFYPANDAESVDLLTEDLPLLRERIAEVYGRTDPIEACCYCKNGDEQFVKRAIQLTDGGAGM